MRPNKCPILPNILSIIVIAIAFVIVITANAATTTQVPGGVVYRLTIRNTQYNFDMKYAAFIPESISTIQGILIHQHGCTMQGTGEATAYDIQYQALAKKWHLAVIGPDLYHNDCMDSAGWIYANKYSGSFLISELDSLARLSGYSAIKTVPWLLWGHSGGGYWALSMMVYYPTRIMAAYSYSPAFHPTFVFPETALKIPTMIRHAGSNDINASWALCWKTSLDAFASLRSRNGYASVGWEAFTNSSHNTSIGRYMAIPFFEAVLAQRLPVDGSTTMRDMDTTKAWLCDTATGQHPVYKLTSFTGNKAKMSWLPDSLTAAKWKEFVTSSSGVVDKTPPPAPYFVATTTVSSTAITLNWKADADIESGIQFFKIYKNNQLLGRIPTSGTYQTFDYNGDNCSPTNVANKTFSITGLATGTNDTFAVTTVNNANLESSKTMILRNGAPINNHPGNWILTTQTPAGVTINTQLELGVKFKADVAGTIWKVRIFTDALESGDHLIRIWRVSDTRLLSGPYTWSITAGTAGWREYSLPWGLNITANTDYILSISTSTDNRYSSTSHGFDTPINNNHLFTYSGSGVYSATLGSMPTTTSVNSNYFRDVYFEAGSTRVSSVQKELPGEYSFIVKDMKGSTALIECNLPKASDIIIKMYNLQGKVARTVSFVHQGAGSHQFAIDLSALSQGYYVIDFRAGNFNVKKSTFVF